MGYNPEVHHRRSIRLSSWDYRDRGAYFFTICTYRRASLFENEYFSRIVEQVWQHVLRAGLHLGADQFTVARDHVHGIVWIDRANAVGRGTPVARIRKRIADDIPGDKHRWFRGVPRPYATHRANRLALCRHRLVLPWDRLNPPPPGVSTRYAEHLARLSGNVVTTSASSAMTASYIGRAPTFSVMALTSARTVTAPSPSTPPNR